MYSTVMVIDDSEMDSFLIKTILSTMNYCKNILTYTNPSNALRYLREIDAGAKDNIPQIIFLDINMPIMNGFDFLNEFYKLPAEITSGVKFYMISSSEDPEDLEKTKKYPAIIKFLCKPLDKNEIIE